MLGGLGGGCGRGERLEHLLGAQTQAADAAAAAAASSRRQAAKRRSVSPSGVPTIRGQGSYIATTLQLLDQSPLL